MRADDCDIAECEFHIDGLNTVLHVLTQMPRADPCLIRMFGYCLQLAHDRLDTLILMKQVSR